MKVVIDRPDALVEMAESTGRSRVTLRGALRRSMDGVMDAVTEYDTLAAAIGRLSAARNVAREAP